MGVNVFVRKVDSQRRITLPRGWEASEVVVEQFDDSLKVVKKSRGGLKKLFDSVETDFFSPNYAELRAVLSKRRVEKCVS